MNREIDDWLATRRRKDVLDQYHAHLTTLGATLDQALGRVRQALDAMPRDGESGAIYRGCRALDGNLVLIHRLWRYFADKLEQRDGAGGALLRAADEVVWSLYAPMVRNAQAHDFSVVFLGPPLPHVEPLFSPRVIPRSEPPRDLRPRDRLLEGMLARLPIPVVSLPPWCVSQPWWLIYLAHEVGHHVQYDLLPGSGLVGACQARLSAVLGRMLGAGAFDPAVQRWLAWNLEMFADVYAALTAGPASVWALGEIVWGDQAEMLAEQAMYPAPALRLALGHAVCARLGAAPALVQGRPVPAWLDAWSAGAGAAADGGGMGVDQAAAAGQTAGAGPAAGAARLAADRAIADAVSLALSEVPVVPGPGAMAGPGAGAAPGTPTLAEICALPGEAAFAPGGVVDQLAAGLRGHAPLIPETVAGANAARLLTSAAVLAYRELHRDLGAAEGGPARDRGQARAEAEARLREVYLDALQRSREPGTRSGETPSERACEQRGLALGDALVDDLLAAPEDLLDVLEGGW